MNDLLKLQHLLVLGLIHLSTSFAIEIKCLPIKSCPMAVRLIQTKFNPSTIAFLNYSMCGVDEKGPKIWCTLFTDKCETPNKRKGTCKPIKECSSFVQILNNTDTENPINRNYLQTFRCNSIHDNEVYVCCADEDETRNKNNRVSVRRNNPPSLPTPERQECGVQVTSDNRIIAGTSTELGEFPWTALLMYPSSSEINLQPGCGGSLLNSRYILTAAHCLDKDILAARGFGILRQVVLGEYDVRNETDCIYFKSGKDCADAAVHYDVESTISHSSWNMYNGKNDIGLIKLATDVTFTDYIRPICLPSPATALNKNETFIITGWGETSTQKMSPIKLKASIKYRRREECEIASFSLSRGQICAGGPKNKDSCRGDSGGPLMFTRAIDSDIVFYVYGIISYGTQKCGSGPSTHTFVPPYIKWINDNINN